MEDGQKVLKIAVTGSAGSGKSVVCQSFKKIGLVVLDCDVIAREVVEPGTAGLKKLVKLFDQKIITHQGALGRSRVRNIIINDPAAREKMESVLHPLILKELVSQMNSAEYKDKKAVAVEVPLLFELDMEPLFDVTITVIAEDVDLVKRICERDCVKKQDALKILALQMPQKEKQKKADYVIVNKGNTAQLFKYVETLFDNIQIEYQKKNS
jgi:dephospho-CoA kinase